MVGKKGMLAHMIPTSSSMVLGMVSSYSSGIEADFTLAEQKIRT